MKGVPSLILVCDPLSGIPVYKEDRTWYIEEDMLQIALRAEPGLYEKIPAGYEREDVIRWGVRNGFDMQAMYHIWTGNPSSAEFRYFFKETHPRMFDEEFGDTMKEVLPFPMHLIFRISEFVVYRRATEDVYLPRNLPVRAYVCGEWWKGTVRKIKHPVYTIKFVRKEEKRLCSRT